MLSLIAIIGKNRELGEKNHLLWHIPGDLPRFKKLTWGHPVIMGRKTHSTFQYKDGAPLPGRTNIVITHDSAFQKEGFIVVHSLDEAIEVANKSPGNEEIFVIGGGQIYAQAIDKADRLYLTIVEAEAPKADTFFPDYSKFTSVVEEVPQAENGISFNYLTLDKKTV